MAREIQVTTRLSWAKNNSQIVASVNEVIDQAGTEVIQNIQIIGLASEAINVGDVSTIGHIMFKNFEAAIDTANIIYIGTTDPVTIGNAELKLRPGEGAYLPTTVALWFAIAAVDNSRLQVVALEA